jgi:manganese/zinc/iron transport system permease protein
MDSLFIILVGALVSINCSIIGSYLMLKKMSMIGDAISHSILPGIVISFLITKSKTSITMIIGSSIIGVITILIIEFLNKKIKIKKNSSIGIVFTFMFSLGVILISLFTKKIDLDQECVLYGELSYVPLNL